MPRLGAFRCDRRRGDQSPPRRSTRGGTRALVRASGPSSQPPPRPLATRWKVRRQFSRWRGSSAASPGKSTLQPPVQRQQPPLTLACSAVTRAPVLGTGAAGSVKAWPRCSTTGHAGCRRRTTRGLACCGGSNKGQTALAVAARPLEPATSSAVHACHRILSFHCVALAAVWNIHGLTAYSVDGGRSLRGPQRAGFLFHQRTGRIARAPTCSRTRPLVIWAT
jgi:hypothetical protein